MTKEPSNSQQAEPESLSKSSSSPLGESGTSEPVVVKEEEPESKKVSEPLKEEPEEKVVSYQDLKTVPKELQPIAKKMQAEYTKDMQALKTIRDSVESIPENQIVPSYTDSPDVREVKEFMESPQGSVLKQAVEEIVSERIGDLPQKVDAAEAEKEIDQAFEKYGKDNITEHYDEIQQAIEQNPGVPFNMICSNILYDIAKEQGKEELRQKLNEKNKKSIEFSGTSPVSNTSKQAKTIQEAFQQSIKKL